VRVMFAGGGDEVCRVVAVVAPRADWMSHRIRMACLPYAVADDYRRRHDGRAGTHRPDGTRYRACAVCWPDGMPEEATG